jgi:hypothetical protein
MALIDTITTGIMLTGIAVVAIPVLLFAVLGVVHMSYGVYTLSRED